MRNVECELGDAGKWDQMQPVQGCTDGTAQILTLTLYQRRSQDKWPTFLGDSSDMDGAVPGRTPKQAEAFWWRKMERKKANSAKVDRLKDYKDYRWKLLINLPAKFQEIAKSTGNLAGIDGKQGQNQASF